MTPTQLMHETEEKMKKAEASVVRSFKEIHGGRATPGLIEGVHVDYYGTPTPLMQLATISTPEPRLFVVKPWDPSAVQAVERALAKAGLGMSPVVDGQLIRLPIPELTKERREELRHVVRKMAEDGRVSVRTIRREANEAVKKLKTEKAINEDQAFTTLEHIQKLTDRTIQQIDQLLKEKDHELEGA